MIHALAVRVCLGCLLALSFPFWGSSSTNAQPPVEPASLSDAGLMAYWQCDLPTVKGEQIVNMFLVDQTLYTVTTRGLLVAVHADTGVIRWFAETGRAGSEMLGVTHGDGIVYVTTTQGIKELERDTGKVLRDRPTEFLPSTAAVGNPRYLLMADREKYLHCVRLSDELDLWVVRTELPMAAPPILAGDTFYFAGRDGLVQAGDMPNKGELWTTQLDGAILGGLAVTEDAVLAGCHDGLLYCLDRARGTIRWQCRTGGQLVAGPAAIDQTVYQYAAGQGIVAVDLASDEKTLWQKPRWEYRRGRQVLAASKTIVYTLTGEGTLAGVDVATGREIVTVAAANIDLTVTNTTNDAIYVATKAGKAMCIRPSSHPYLTLDKVSEVWRRRPPADQTPVDPNQKKTP